MSPPPEFRMLDLRGFPPGWERGAAFGESARREVGHSIDFYRWLLPEYLGCSWESMIEPVSQHLAAAAARWPALVEELRGVAAGAAVAEADVMVLNARSEIMATSGAARPGECTTVARLGLVGQTWDWYTAQAPACVLVRTDRYLAFTEAGMPAKIGVNAAGLGVTLNFLSTTIGPEQPGVPVHLLLHAVLDNCTKRSEAEAVLCETEVAASAAVVVADRDGASVIELGPDSRSSVVERESTLVHTNHCTGTAMRGLDVTGFLLDNSRARHGRAEELFASGADVAALLADTAGSSPIDIPVHPEAPPLLQVGTVAAVVIDPGRSELRISRGRPSEAGYGDTVCL